MKDAQAPDAQAPEERSDTVGDIEEGIPYLKERVFELEHMDSPHFIDCQNAFDVMEVNYLRLKQRLSHTPEKVLEIAKDWQKYAEALGDLKNGRVMLDLDSGEDAYDKADEAMKEPSIIKDEVEKKFKSLLNDDYQKIPLNYFERMDTMEEPKIKPGERLGDEWKHYYGDCANLYNLEEKRRKETEERETNKEKENK